MGKKRLVDNQQLLEKFYTSFQQLDAEGMASCYHQEIVFSDPAFGELNGDRAANMWRMLCESQKGKGFRVLFADLKVMEDKGSARWEAFYTFSKTARKVHNKISANFEFKDGLIIKHQDSFNLHKWAKQALGWRGRLIGYTTYFRKKLQKQTNKLLNRFEEKLKLEQKVDL